MTNFAAPKIEFSRWPREPRRALVVDDDSYQRRLTGQLLEILGFAPMLAADGDLAAALFRAAPDDFAFVVVDAHLAGANDEQTVEKLRRIRGDVPIVYLTDEKNKPDRRWLDDGFVDWVTVPISFGQLDSAVRKATRLRRSPSLPPPLSP